MFHFCKQGYKANLSQYEYNTAKFYCDIIIIVTTFDKKTVRVKANYLQYKLEVDHPFFNPNPVPFEYD